MSCVLVNEASIEMSCKDFHKQFTIYGQLNIYMAQNIWPPNLINRSQYMAN